LILDVAKGCILGAFVGDAAGAVLEHADDITDENVQNALKLIGGGMLDLGQG